MQLVFGRWTRGEEEGEGAKSHDSNGEAHPNDRIQLLGQGFLREAFFGSYKKKKKRCDLETGSVQPGEKNVACCMMHCKRVGLYR